jgi:hypothetical protein
MRADPIEEPPVVRDDNRTSSEVLQSLLQCAYGIYIGIIGRLIKQQYIGLAAQCQCQVQAVTLTA